MTTESNKPPVHRIPLGRIRVAVWQHESESGRKYYSVSLKRSFKTDEGEFRDTSSLDADDLPNAARALEAAPSSWWILCSYRALKPARV